MDNAPQLLKALETDNDNKILDLINRETQNEVINKLQTELKKLENELDIYQIQLNDIRKDYNFNNKLYKGLRDGESQYLELKEMQKKVINYKKEYIKKFKYLMKVEKNKKHRDTMCKIKLQEMKEEMKEYKIDTKEEDEFYPEVRKRIATRHTIKKLLTNDKKILNQVIKTTKTNTQNLKGSITKYDGKMKLLINVKRSLNNYKDEKCIICVDIKNSTAFKPCGHLYCHNCIKKLTKCAICRVEKEGVYHIN